MSVYDRVAEHGLAETKDAFAADDDDWETDPEPANNISEAEQRWGAATLPKDAKDFRNIDNLRDAVKEQHEKVAQEEYAATKRAVGDTYGQEKLRNK
ncbi:Hematopoietic lineage cell-specific protein [Balamuthia mandrillaris]